MGARSESVPMSIASYIPLASNCLGFIGTAIVFFNSYSVEPSPVAQCGAANDDDEVTTKNTKRVRNQRIGFFLIGLGFGLSILSFFLTK